MTVQGPERNINQTECHTGGSRTQKRRWWTPGGPGCGDSENSQTIPATTSTAPGTQTTVRRWRTNGTRRNQHSPGTPTTRLRECGNDTSRSTGRSGQQNAAIRRNTRREDRVTVQGPVKRQRPDGMSHRGGGTDARPCEGLEKWASGAGPFVLCNNGRRRRNTHFRPKQFFPPKDFPHKCVSSQ